MTSVQEEEEAATEVFARNASSASANAAAAGNNNENNSATANKATDAEIKRFRTIFPKEHAVKIRAYLDWRHEYCLHHDDSKQLCSNNDSSGNTDNNNDNNNATMIRNDAQIWEWAVQKAVRQAATTAEPKIKKNLADNEETSSSASSSPALSKHWNHKQNSDKTESTTDSKLKKSANGTTTPTINLPQVVFCHNYFNDQQSQDPFSGCFRDRDGRRILHVLAARLDPQAASVLTHTNVMALYLDQMFHRYNGVGDRVTILLDTRPGQGWRNPPALELVGLIRHAATRLHELYPDRLHKCILYPIPRAAIFFWNMIKVFLDASVRSAITLVPGDASSPKSPLPRKQLVGLGIDESCLDHCEKMRLATFTPASRRSG